MVSRRNYAAITAVMAIIFFLFKYGKRSLERL